MNTEQYKNFISTIKKDIRVKRLICTLLFALHIAGIVAVIYWNLTGLAVLVGLGWFVWLLAFAFALFGNVHTVYKGGHYYTIYNKMCATYHFYIDGRKVEPKNNGYLQKEYRTPEGKLVTLDINRGRCTLFFAGDSKPIAISMVFSEEFIND